MSTSSNMSTTTFAYSDVEYDSGTSYGSSLNYSATLDSTTDDFEGTSTSTSNHSTRSTSTISTTSTLLSATPHIAFDLPLSPKATSHPPQTLAALTRDREEQLYRQKALRRAARAHHFTRHLHTALCIFDASLADFVCPSVERATAKGDLAARESQLAALKAEELRVQIRTLRSQNESESKSRHASAHQADFQTKRAAWLRDEAVAVTGVRNTHSSSSSSSNAITRVFSIPSLRRQFSSSSSSSSTTTTTKQRAKASKEDEKEKERQIRAKQYDYIYGINPSFADGFPA